MNSEIKNYFEKYADNKRKDSIRFVYDYIVKHDFKKLIEFGMSRISDLEGDFTILAAMMAKTMDLEFSSVEISWSTVDKMNKWFNNSSNEIFNNDQGTIELIHQDQYDYMKSYNGKPYQYVFLDGDDQNKHGAFQTLLDSKMLAPHALICIDDMVAQNWWGDNSYFKQAKEIVRIVNEDSRLTPLDAVEYSPPNEIQLKCREYNKKYPIPDNTKVYPKGVRQFDWQIILEYKEI